MARFADPWNATAEERCPLKVEAGLREATEAESWANMEPSPRYPGEMIFAISMLAFVLLVTCGIASAAVLLVEKPDPWRSSLLLGALGVLALHLGLYLFKIGFGAHLWVCKFNAAKDQDWYAVWQSEQDRPNVVAWSDVQHFVIVTAYREPLESLKSIARSLAQQRTPAGSTASFAKRHIALVLAMEEREGNCAHAKAREVEMAFREDFRSILTIFHPADQPEEIAGKASNFRWAVKQLDERIWQGMERETDVSGADAGPILAENCLIHVADADSLYDRNHFPFVTRDFCASGGRYESVWQPCMLPTRNFWELPRCSRQVSIGVAAQEMMSGSGILEFQIPFSTYGLPLETLRRIGGAFGAAAAQDGDVIAEDHHLFIKGFCATSGRLQVKPVPLPCFSAAVPGCECASRSCCLRQLLGGKQPDALSGAWDSRLTQAKRHMFGVAELAFLLSLLVRGGCRFRFGRCWLRVLTLCMKLLKIHTVSFQGLWISLGVLVSVAHEVRRQSCSLHGIFQLVVVCTPEDARSARSSGEWLFALATGFCFLSSTLVMSAFVRSLRATQGRLSSIADPGSSASLSSIADRGSSARSPELAGRGVAWILLAVELTLEYLMVGIFSTLAYGVLPSFAALFSLAWNGHRVPYVSAAQATAANSCRISHEDLRCGTAKTTFSSLRSMFLTLEV